MFDISSGMLSAGWYKARRRLIGSDELDAVLRLPYEETPFAADLPAAAVHNEVVELGDPVVSADAHDFGHGDVHNLAGVDVAQAVFSEETQELALGAVVARVDRKVQSPRGRLER